MWEVLVYNLISRDADYDLIPFLKDSGTAFTVYNPLAGGMLTGKQTRDKAEEGSRFDTEEGYRRRYWRESTFRALDRMAEISAETGIPQTSLALRWLISKDYITCIIIGCSRISHLEQNLSFLEDGSLSEDILSELDALWNCICGDYFRYHA